MEIKDFRIKTKTKGTLYTKEFKSREHKTIQINETKTTETPGVQD